MEAYLNGIFLPKEEVRISPDDRGFLFADGLYEYIRSYRGRLFRLEDHIRRLNYGAEQMRFTTTDFSFLGEIAEKLLTLNALNSAEASVYFQVTRGVAPRRHAFPLPAPGLTVYGTVSTFDESGAARKRKSGIRAITVADCRWARCDIKATGLTANILANQRAVDEDAAEAIFVRDGVMLEGSHTNFMAVLDNILVTAPLSNYILGGITRKAILEICRKENIIVAERPIFEEESCLASEMMVVGSSTEITPVIALDGQPVGDGQPGPMTRLLQHAFTREIENLGERSL